MLSPKHVLTLSNDDIRSYYAGVHWVPSGKRELGVMTREQLLQMREMLVFTADLVQRGRIEDDGCIEAWENAIKPLEEYVRKSYVFSCTK